MIHFQFGNAKVNLYLPENSQEETLPYFIRSFEGNALPDCRIEISIRPAEKAPPSAVEIGRAFGLSQTKVCRKKLSSISAQLEIFTIIPSAPNRSDRLSSIVVPAILYALSEFGIVPIHASSVLFNGKAVLFAGRSGSGKSTIAERLSSEGFEFLSDDRILLWKEEIEGKSIIKAVPSFELQNPFTRFRLEFEKRKKSSRRRKAEFGKTAELSRIIFVEVKPFEESQIYTLSKAPISALMAVSCGGYYQLDSLSILESSMGEEKFLGLTLGKNENKIFKELVEVIRQ
ncbi:MAG: hypothetical protein COS94_03405 [Candidatus Hydrogenedentes bacterium CG07_land_8_20_14_0_80_42_17]|nr:MAG: hypothetical protein COS94_03405 [Candidatus Hydrogenedentes bacterium CG07_land_8_20_14_0_80_42_17]